MSKPRTLDASIAPPIYAWVGDDEGGAGWIGFKQVMVKDVPLPLVFVERHLDRALHVKNQLHNQAVEYEKTIRLVKYVPVEVIEELT